TACPRAAPRGGGSAAARRSAPRPRPASARWPRRRARCRRSAGPAPGRYRARRGTPAARPARRHGWGRRPAAGPAPPAGSFLQRLAVIIDQRHARVAQDDVDIVLVAADEAVQLPLPFLVAGPHPHGDAIVKPRPALFLEQR